MAAQFIFFMSLTLMLESLRFSLKDKNKIINDDIKVENEMDDGVAK
jgi:hypothetical protein